MGPRQQTKGTAKDFKAIGAMVKIGLLTPRIVPNSIVSKFQGLCMVKQPASSQRPEVAEIAKQNRAEAADRRPGEGFQQTGQLSE